MSSMALDRHDPQNLRRAYHRHETVKQAAQEFSVSYATVRQRMIQYGIHTPCSHSRYGATYNDA